MSTKEQEKNLKKFFEAIDRVTNRGLYDLGLVVKTEKQKTSDLVRLIPKDKRAEVFKFNNKLIADDLLKFIIKIFEEKKWGFIELEDIFLPGKVYNQLRLLSISNRLQVLGLAGSKEGEINLKQPKESRIIMIGNEDILSQIKIPTFLRLFGPIINLK